MLTNHTTRQSVCQQKISIFLIYTFVCFCFLRFSLVFFVFLIFDFQKKRYKKNRTRGNACGWRVISLRRFVYFIRQRAEQIREDRGEDPLHEIDDLPEESENLQQHVENSIDVKAGVRSGGLVENIRIHMEYLRYCVYSVIFYLKKSIL